MVDDVAYVDVKDAYVAKRSSRKIQTAFSLAWSNISYTVTDKAKPLKILKNVTGRTKAGEITAIMGPSGSGKTTLLDILGDRLSSGKIDGEIYVNGESRQERSFRAISSYVAQEDTLMGSFTTLETLRYAATLSLPASFSKSVREERVQEAINDMGLRGCLTTKVGDLFRKGLSGGQKRRLSIAIELLARPSIMLLDEPSSGLDSASTENVIEYILSLAREGRSIICTIHQPSSTVYNMFDNIGLLVSGETVYFGPRSHTIDFFRNLGHECPQYYNPAEYCLSLINTDFKGRHGDVPRFINAYASSALLKNLKEQIELEKSNGSGVTKESIVDLKPSAIDQFMVILHRNSLDNIRNPGIYWVRLTMYSILCLMIGTMYLYTNDDITENDLVPMLFYVQAFLVFMSVAVLPFFIEHRAVFARERINSSLNVGSYVVANFLASLPGIFLIALISSVLIVFLADLNSFSFFLLNLFLSLVIAESLMSVLAAAVPHYIIGIALGAGIFGWFMLVMGFLVPRDSIPGYWIWGYYIAFHTYSFQSFVYGEFKDDGEGTLGNDILIRLNMEDVDVAKNMLILAVYAIVLQIIFALILYKFHTGRR